MASPCHSPVELISVLLLASAARAAGFVGNASPALAGSACCHASCSPAREAWGYNRRVRGSLAATGVRQWSIWLAATPEGDDASDVGDNKRCVGAAGADRT